MTANPERTPASGPPLGTVIDVTGYLPRIVRLSAEIMKSNVGRMSTSHPSRSTAISAITAQFDIRSHNHVGRTHEVKLKLKVAFHSGVSKRD
jgi:hypothetical protein